MYKTILFTSYYLHENYKLLLFLCKNDYIQLKYIS